MKFRQLLSKIKLLYYLFYYYYYCLLSHNKVYKLFIKHYIKNNSRSNQNENVMNILFIFSDTLIFTIRKQQQ